MASTDPARPNIILFLTDDQGCWAMGCAGNSEIRTPHLEGKKVFGDDWHYLGKAQ